jgi:Cu/Ag efflux pump CusA
MVGAFVIILDPIFQGLAVSLLFGVGASTVLTLVVIPLLYYLWIGGARSEPACNLPDREAIELTAQVARERSG